MNFLKRATPWMITLVILLGVYGASYVWWYKPNQLTGAITIGSGSGSGSFHMPLKKTKNTLLDQFYMPLRLCEEERTKQKARKELLRQCQGDWEGRVWLRPQNHPNTEQSIDEPIQVCASVKGDQFIITRAELRPELEGINWKIGCVQDANTQMGVFTNNYPVISSIFLTYTRAPSGQELLSEGAVVQWVDHNLFVFYIEGNVLQRPSVTPPPSN